MLVRYLRSKLLFTCLCLWAISSIGCRPAPRGHLQCGTARYEWIMTSRLAELCERGNVRACYTSGLFLERGGYNVPKVPSRAVALYRKACDGGMKKACSAYKRLKNTHPQPATP